MKASNNALSLAKENLLMKVADQKIIEQEAVQKLTYTITMRTNSNV